MSTINLDKLAKRTAEQALDIVYEGKPLREWIRILKEQKPVKPTYENFFGDRVARCGYCNGYIVRYKYCPGCGRKVDWSE